MGAYLDTNVIIAYTLEEGKKILNAHYLVDTLLKDEDLYISHFTILEFYVFLSRNPTKYKIPPALEKCKPSKSIRVRIAWEYTIKSLGLKIYEDSEETKIFRGSNTRTNKIFYESIAFAPNIQLPTGDLIHATYAHLMKIEDKVDKIVTFDKDFNEKADLIKLYTGLKLIYRSDYTLLTKIAS